MLLEGYSQISRHAANLPWLATKIYFISNRFDSDELFKFWCASKLKLELNILLGLEIMVSPKVDKSINELVSDKFLTWGGLTDSLNIYQH